MNMHKSSKRIFVTDCEGPISKNDNAYELCCHFIPDGDKFFSIISKYDDVLADILKRHGYRAGHTLKLVLPFLKAYGVTNQTMKEFSEENIVLLPDAKGTMQFVRKTMPSFIVSTSYEHYMFALCKAIDFPFENTYHTRADIDKYSLTDRETEMLKQIAKEIAAMPMIEIPKNAKSLRDFSQHDQYTIRRLDEIFWRRIPRMPVGKIFDEVTPVGGKEKANAVQEIVNRCRCSVDCVMYVGDSITDVECFQFVRSGDGLTFSFNGNEYAVREAEIAVMSENTIVTSILADVFARFGKDFTMQFAKEWSFSGLKRFEVNPSLSKRVQQLYPKSLPRVEIITRDNKEKLAKESVIFRKNVRGEAIARLG
jgi:energy-converting hydrogenase A subunit R